MQRKGKKRETLKGKKKLKLDNNNNNNNNNKFNTRMVSMEREKIDNYCDLKYEIKS